MRGENGTEVSVIEWVSDVRTLVGASVALVGALLLYIGWAYKVAEAPAKADMAIDSANQALEVSRNISTEVQDTKQTLRIVFCTSATFDLSGSARAQLECWRVKGGPR